MLARNEPDDCTNDGDGVDGVQSLLVLTDDGANIPTYSVSI